MALTTTSIRFVGCIAWLGMRIGVSRMGVLGGQDLLLLFPRILFFEVSFLCLDESIFTTTAHWKETCYKDKFSRQEWCGYVFVLCGLCFATWYVAGFLVMPLFSKATKPFIATALMRFVWLSGSRRSEAQKANLDRSRRFMIPPRK